MSSNANIIWCGSEEAWLEARKTGIGASEAAAVLGASRYQTPRQLWAAKAGLPHDPIVVHDRMRWGHIMEPVAAAWLKSQGIAVERAAPYTLHRSKQAPYLFASPDAWVSIEPGHAVVEPGRYMVDFKIAHPMDSSYRDGGVPAGYELQIQHQMLVTGADRGMLVVLPFSGRVDMPGDWTEAAASAVQGIMADRGVEFALGFLGVEQPIMRVFEQDLPLQRYMAEECRKFWLNVVRTRDALDRGAGWDELRSWEPPAMAADIGDLGRRYEELRADAEEMIPTPLARGLFDAKDALDALSVRYDNLRARVIQRMGDKQRAYALFDDKRIPVGSLRKTRSGFTFYIGKERP